MHRHSPIGNQTSKGIKIKHVLQICLLVAVCCWLIFQINRSHCKKKDFDSSDTKMSVSMQSGGEVLRFGRKDLQPEEIEKHEEEEDEDETEEGDKIDENEQQEEDMPDESEEKDGQRQSANEGSSEGHDQDGVDRNIHEAREEHYRADDASSAVAREHKIRTLDNSGKHENRVKNGEDINASQDSTMIIQIKEKDGETAKNGASSNTRVIQETGSYETWNIEETTKENPSGSAETNAGMGRTEETLEDRDGVRQYAIDSTGFQHLNDKEIEMVIDTVDGNGEDTAAE